MKYITKVGLAFLMVCMVCGCSMFKEASDDVNNAIDKVEDTTTNEEGKLSDLMTYLKDNKITLEDEEELNNFNFAAKEGRSFTYDGNKVYVYSVDTANAAIRTLMNQALTNNQVVASVDGKEVTYGASANDNYLMIYELEAKVDDLLDNFKNYKYEKNSAK